MTEATKAAICSLRPAQRTTVPRDFRVLALNYLVEPLFFSFYNAGKRDFVASGKTGSLLFIDGKVQQSSYSTPREAIGGAFVFCHGDTAL